MIKNRTVQIIYQTIYFSLAMVGLLASIGLFDAKYNPNFYVYFTNISNCFCAAIMLLELKETAKKQSDSFVKTAPMMKFFGVIMILITFFIFNLLLAKDRSIEENMSIESILFHAILPVMYFFDWVLFYKRGKLKWYHPIGAMIVPVIYVFFVFLRGWMINWQGELVYPYFFLNVDKIGAMGVFKWIITLLIIFFVLGYILYFMDRNFAKTNDKIG